MRKHIVLAALGLALSGCAGPSKTVDIHTGEAVYRSSTYQASGGLLSNFNVIGRYSNKDGYGLSTNYIATGGSWMHFREAWSYGKQYPFVVTAQRVAGCGAGCTLIENGIISLSEVQFREAASKGFTFELVGEGGKVSGTAPAKAFQEVLKQKP